ncbi:MAG: ATP-binding cassette domain-containing protein [Anaerolineaceae bacterium]|nr:ATP-binding cassette domain-containing protein [Anaerolineaceae bacterium]
MTSIVVDRVVKKFGNTLAVDHASFQVQAGTIFGLLGPNGAGKTTLIRIILDIFKADSGSVQVLGGKMTEEKKNRIGYLPEERGLYQDIQLESCLLYLASLKGLSKSVAQKRLQKYLEKFDLAEHRKKKIKELSKGMQQKAQLIATLIHHPEVIIIDEPFTALDPVNTQMVKEILHEERRRGTAVIMCTHQMHQAESMCDEIVLIDKGKVLLNGDVQKIRQSYSGRDIILQSQNGLPDHIAGIASMKKENGGYCCVLEEGVSAQDLLKSLVEQGISLNRFEVAVPSLDEIFIEVVKGQTEQRDE